MQELAYVTKRNVKFLVYDMWGWGAPPTRAVLEPYLQAYAARWRPAWSDPRGSGVRVYERLP